MRVSSERGLTLIELLVAIVILGIGLMLLAGGSLVVTRDLTRSSRATVATGQAQAKLDELMVLAASTSTRCTATSFASSSSPVVSNKVTLSWDVPLSGTQRMVSVITSYQLPASGSVSDSPNTVNGIHTDTLRAMIGC
ncbi:MAG TPA: type II secretion system protein [Gemmatimonadales bacterium]|nr:type II secretion system protein [Gemmatimonadales bacterium]